MTPEYLAALHRRAARGERAWSAAEFARMLDNPATVLSAVPESFAIGRVVADEGELDMIATDPDHRRRGHGARCLSAFVGAMRERGAARLFLEVAEDNPPARGLYARGGWREIGRRRDYYVRAGARVDAILMSLELTVPPRNTRFGVDTARRAFLSMNRFKSTHQGSGDFPARPTGRQR